MLLDRKKWRTAQYVSNINEPICLVILPRSRDTHVNLSEFWAPNSRSSQQSPQHALIRRGSRSQPQFPLSPYSSMLYHIIRSPTSRISGRSFHSTANFTKAQQQGYHDYIRYPAQGRTVRIPLNSPKVVGVAVSRGNRE
jgi:hypothetical protein